MTETVGIALAAIGLLLLLVGFKNHLMFMYRHRDKISFKIRFNMFRVTEEEWQRSWSVLTPENVAWLAKKVLLYWFGGAFLLILGSTLKTGWVG